MNLMARRRALIIAGITKKEELYPVGTKLRQYYGVTWTTGYAIDRDTGEYGPTDSAAFNRAFEFFIPVSTEYTYQKNNNRIYTLACYDNDKNYIGWFVVNSLDAYMPEFLPGTKFIRITAWSGNNLLLELTRIA